MVVLRWRTSVRGRFNTSSLYDHHLTSFSIDIKKPSSEMHIVQSSRCVVFCTFVSFGLIQRWSACFIWGYSLVKQEFNKDSVENQRMKLIGHSGVLCRRCYPTQAACWIHLLSLLMRTLRTVWCWRGFVTLVVLHAALIFSLICDFCAWLWSTDLRERNKPMGFGGVTAACLNHVRHSETLSPFL